jgi:hypothetical protein
LFTQVPWKKIIFNKEKRWDKEVNRLFWYIYVSSRIFGWYSAGLRAEWSGVRVQGRAGNFSLHHRVQTGLGPTEPPIQ